MIESYFPANAAKITISNSVSSAYETYELQTWSSVKGVTFVRSKLLKNQRGMDEEGSEKRRLGRDASLISSLRAPVMELRHWWKSYQGIVAEMKRFDI